MTRRSHLLMCVSLQLLEASIRPETSLVSVMTVNNEIGVKQPIEDIGNHGNTRYWPYRGFGESH